MLKRICLVFIVFAAVAACTPKEDQKPEGLLQEQQMQQVLTDILISEAYVSSLNLPPDSSRKVNQKLHEAVFQRHKISREQYDQSMSYYSRHPDIFEQIFQPVIDSLRAGEARIY